MTIKIYEGNSLVGNFDYTEFKKLSFEEKERVYNLKHIDRCKIICDCAGNEIELTVANRNENIFIKNNPGNGDKHNKACRLHSNYKSDNEYEKGWQLDEEDGTLVANLPSQLFGARRANNNGGQIIGRRFYVPIDGGIGENKVTLFGLMCKLNIMAWDEFVNNKRTVPANIDEFLRQSFGTSRLIKIKRKNSLKSYWFNFNKIKDLQENEFMFVYMPFINVTPTKSKNYYTVELAQFINGELKKVLINCKVEMFQEALNSIRNKTIVYENGDFKAIVGGFIKKNTKGYLNFVSLEIMPIIAQGLWAESSFEKQIYSKLINEGRLFSKGYEGVEFYNNFVPDIIFRDTTRPYIGEIFGIRDIETYNERKMEKIKLSLEERDNFDFWYWDVTEAAIPPEF